MSPLTVVGSDEKPEERHAERLDERTIRENDRADEAEHHEAEVLGRLELERDLNQRRREGGDHEGRDAAREEGAERRDTERRAGAPLCRHLVAIETRDHG